MFTFDYEIDVEFIDSYEETEAAQPTPKKSGHKSPPKDFPTDKSQYADPKNFKYPIDTEKRVRSALSYFSNPDNRKEYTSEEQKFIWGRILRAAKKFGIKISKEVKSRAGEVNVMTDVEKLKDVFAHLQTIAESMGKTPDEENKEEITKLGDRKLMSEASEALKTAIAKFEEVYKDLSDKLNVKPLITPEELEALKAKASEGEKAVQELSEIKLQAVMASRLTELTESGIRLGDELGKTQEDRVKAMSDEQFKSYKDELLAVKAALEKAEADKKAAEAQKAEAEKAVEAEKAKAAEAEAERLKAEAAKTPAKPDLSQAKAKQGLLATVNQMVKVDSDKVKEYAKI